MIRHQVGNSKGNYNFNAYTYFGVSWAPHFHSNYELIYALGGEIRLTVDGRSEILREGDYALILSNQVHSISGELPFCMWIAVFSEQFIPYFAEKYKELAAGINLTVYSEWKGYSDFRAQFTDNAVGKISESVNDAYLTVQGTEGVKSYGLVVDLAVAYYQNRIE